MLRNIQDSNSKFGTLANQCMCYTGQKIPTLLSEVKKYDYFLTFLLKLGLQQAFLIKSSKETIFCCKLHWSFNHSLSYDVYKGFHLKVIFSIDKKFLLVSTVTKNSWLQFLNGKGYESLLLEKILVDNIFKLQRRSISISLIRTFLIDKGYCKF